MRTEWVIHIWGKERDSLELTPQEKFHMDMIGNYDHSIFDKVLINIAMYDINDENLFEFLKGVLELPDKLGTEFYCVDTIDGIEFCTSEKECQKLLMRDWCDVKWEELNDKMLRIWIDRLAEEDPEYWY